MINYSNYAHPEVAITVTNTANLTADQFIGATAPVSFDATNIKLTMTKTADHASYYNGQTVTYTITVNNAADSDADATNVNVQDTIPIQLKGVTASSSSGTPTVTGDDTTGYAVSHTLATLAKGASATITITGTLAL